MSVRMPTATRPRVLVIGGGVAGGATAIGLARIGFDVSLREKREFPRNKTCGGCLGGPGIRELDRLGVMDDLRRESVRIRRWKATVGRFNSELEIPRGIAVSRSVLDTLLLRHAERLGVDVADGVAGQIQSVDDDRVEVRIGEYVESYDLVILATGLSGPSMNRWLPWVQRPAGKFGMAFRAKGEFPEETVHMICGRGGYVGMVRLHDGTVDVAAALQTRMAATDGHPSRIKSNSGARSGLNVIEQLIHQAGLDDALGRPLGDVMTTGLLHRRRTAANGRLFVVGDAAGYREPFTGEGMTWAMRDARRLTEVLTRNPHPAQAAQRWQKLHRRGAQTQWTCRLCVSMLASKGGSALCGWTLQNAPWIGNHVLRRMVA